MNLHVLVIDDNVDLAQLLCDLLQAFGNKCDVATDGRRGIASARDNPPALEVGFDDHLVKPRSRRGTSSAC